MATPEEREQESRESDVTKFEEQLEQDREEQHEAVEKIAEPLEPRDDDDTHDPAIPGGRIATRMRVRGLEPPRAEAHQDLNLARIPVPPHPRDSQDREPGT